MGEIKTTANLAKLKAKKTSPVAQNTSKYILAIWIKTYKVEYRKPKLYNVVY